MNRFVEGLKGLGTMRLIGIAAVGVAVMAIVGLLALRGNSKPQALLYGDLELRDSGQVTATLDKLHVPYELRGGGSQVFVASDQVDQMRLALAREGLPTGGSVGYEIFDHNDGLTSSQFQQQINQLRALEGELARTIRTIHGVRNARVHLVLPKREPFAREQQQAQASVVLAMAGGRMGNDEVQAILNLVASAVPGLKADNVSIVDDRGELLARAGRNNGTDGAVRNHEEVKLATEQRLSQSVEDMLGRTLGAGHVRAEAAVEMDFDHTAETQERFDPDGQVPRTTQNITDSSKNTEAQQNVSVQNNLPNPEPAGGGASGSASNRQEENTTFEIGKTVKTMTRDTPTIKKISMAVLVDGTTTVGADGKPSWAPLPQADLDRIATLVKSAVGYDEKRGDRVDIVNMRFTGGEVLPDAAPAGFWGVQLGKADVMWLATLGIIALVAVFALAFVIRPLAIRLVTAFPPATPELDSAADTLALANAANALVAAPDGEDDGTMLNIANIDGELRASSLRKLTQIVETNPDATMNVMRGWLTQKVD
jgi:flagellar M-ring protein FliF